uniref:Uncharacterized protein n=1 Tax=Caenorhabditis japonica TaxID=281687 RepID=A0A8R1HTU8_CAEJA
MKEHSRNDKNVCKESFRALESLLIKEAADASFAAINANKYGFYSPRTELRTGRLYYLAEPMLVRFAEKEGKSHADSSYLDLLPYLEISFVKHDKPCKLPSLGHGWNGVNEARVCICVKFKNGFLFSHETIRKMAKFVPRAPLIRHYVNFYRYMTGVTGEDVQNMKKTLLTQFPEPEDVQQKFHLDTKKFQKEDDAVVVEMFLSDLNDLSKIIEILRSEWKHSSLWESILAMCEPRPRVEQAKMKFVNLQLALKRAQFLLQFETEFGDMTSEFLENFGIFMT